MKPTSPLQGEEGEGRVQRGGPRRHTQPAGIRRPPHRPSTRSPPRTHQRDRQQHDEVRLVFARQAALHRQPPVHVRLAREAGGQPAERWIRQPRGPHRPHRATEAEGGLPVRPLRRARTTGGDAAAAQVGLLQPSHRGRHQRRGLRPRPRGVDHFRHDGVRRVSRPVPAHRRTSTRRRLRAVPLHVHGALRSRPCSLLHRAGPQLGRHAENDGRVAGALHRP